MHPAKVSSTLVISQNSNLHDVINRVSAPQRDVLKDVHMISAAAAYRASVTNPGGGLCALHLGVRITKKNTVQSSTGWSNALLT